MARGIDTGDHPNRQVGRPAYSGRKSSYGGVQSSVLDAGHAPFHGEGADDYYNSLLSDYKRDNAKKALDYANGGTAPFHGELADEYYADVAKDTGRSELWREANR